MKYKLIIPLLFFSLVASSQKYEAFDGTMFKEGDSVLIGEPSEDGYRNIYYYDDGFSDVEQHLGGNKFLIKSVKKAVNLSLYEDNWYFDKNEMILKFGKKGLFGNTYYMNIEKAIKSGEVVIKLPPDSLYSKNKRINDTISFVYFVKISDKPIDNFTKEYLYRFMHELYEDTKEDEFEYQNSISKAKNKLSKSIKNCDFDEKYTMYTQLQLSKYNFDKKGFMIKDDKLLYEVVENVRLSTYSSISILFPNYEKFKFVHVNPEDANAFVKRRKDKGGHVDREVYAKINFKFINPNKYKKDISKKYSQNLLFGKIRSIELYDFENYNYNWIGTVK